MITKEEYASRRRSLINKIGNDSIAIIPGAVEVSRNADSDYPFRQDSDFYYLTGLEEPEAILVLVPGHPDGESILFNRTRNKEQEIWTGPRLGQSGAKQILGMDQSFPIEELDERIPRFLENRTQVHYSVGKDQAFDNRVQNWVSTLKPLIRKGIAAPDEFISIAEHLHELRLKKSEKEIALMRKAAQVSAKAHQRAMRACKPDMFEYELEAELHHEFTVHGCRYPAYTSIVGSGANSCVLHYTANGSKMNQGDLVLIDAGAECDNYASDVTRTFPVNGKFTDPQRAIYDLVLRAQCAGIDKVQAGVAWNEIQNTVIQIITTGLCELGLLSGDVDALIKEQAYKEFYMHNSGHWLGLDVHDAGKYKVNNEWRKLEPGMVLTVEPGIYISENKAIDKKWWNIGVRIEDDVLVTEQGSDVLSKDVPKTIDEIEALMASN